MITNEIFFIICAVLLLIALVMAFFTVRGNRRIDKWGLGSRVGMPRHLLDEIEKSDEMIDEVTEEIKTVLEKRIANQGSK